MNIQRKTLSLTIGLIFLGTSSLSAAQSKDLTAIKSELAAGQQSASQLLQTYQSKSAQLNPYLNAVTVLRDQANQEARQADARKDGRAPLHGLPLMVKDNIAVQGMVTTAGSLALADNLATEDAFIVKRLREAGAIIAGKTNLSEWANFRSTKSTSGWSSVGGQTRNPYDPRKSPCGSSSGSGAAVAAGMIPAAIGTETDGSIVCPAAVNGLVGLKPTLGLVSRAGIVPLSHSQDTAGPMTLSVRDAALLMNVIAGSDKNDPATVDADRQRATDYTAGLNPQALKGKRLGLVKNLSSSYDKATQRLLRDSIAILKAQGATVIEEIELPHLADLDKLELPVLLYDFKADLNQYLAAAPSQVKVRTMADVMRFNQTHRQQVMPYFGQEIMQMAQAKAGLNDPTYQTAATQAKLLAGPKGIDALMQQHQLDALIAPTTGSAWDINYKKGDVIAGSASSPAAIAGYPHLTVPMGVVKGLPVGLSFFAGAWKDAELLNMGYAFEQARPALPAPDLQRVQDKKFAKR